MPEGFISDIEPSQGNTPWSEPVRRRGATAVMAAGEVGVEPLVSQGRDGRVPFGLGALVADINDPHGIHAISDMRVLVTIAPPI